MSFCWRESKGYGDFGNTNKIRKMKRKSPEEQKAYIKELWQKDPKKYYEWKEYCISIGGLPDLFGHANNPIPIDESKL